MRPHLSLDQSFRRGESRGAAPLAPNDRPRFGPYRPRVRPRGPEDPEDPAISNHTGCPAPCARSEIPGADSLYQGAVAVVERVQSAGCRFCRLSVWPRSAPRSPGRPQRQRRSALGVAVVGLDMGFRNGRDDPRVAKRSPRPSVQTSSSSCRKGTRMPPEIKGQRRMAGRLSKSSTGGERMGPDPGSKRAVQGGSRKDGLSLTARKTDGRRGLLWVARKSACAR